jgi:hypothetical protein
LWLTVFIGMILIGGTWHEWRPLDFLRAVVWPTPYPFLTQIIVFYPAFYLVRAAKSTKVEFGMMLGLCAPYLAFALFHYDLHVLSWIFYFQVMLLGGLLAGRVKEMGSDWRRHLGVLTPVLLIYMGVKLAMVTGRIPSHVMVLHVLTFPILFNLLGICAAAPLQGLARRPRLGAALGLVAGLTLEIYLVHGFIYAAPRVRTLVFPINLAAFWAATLPLAWLLSTASNRASRLMDQGSRAVESLAGLGGRMRSTAAMFRLRPKKTGVVHTEGSQ